jgi:hypothetical protein
MNYLNDDTLDTLVESITSLDFLAPPATVPTRLKPQKPRITPDTVEEFVLKSSEELINAGLESIDELKDIVVQGQNPDEIESLAGLMASTVNAIEILNKSVLLKKKHESAKELKAIDIENRKEINNTLNNTTINNTNVLVTSREEIFKRFLQNESDSKTPLHSTNFIEDT